MEQEQWQLQQQNPSQNTQNGSNPQFNSGDNHYQNPSDSTHTNMAQIPNDTQLIRIIQSTYLNILPDNKELKIATDWLHRQLENDEFAAKLIFLLEAQNVENSPLKINDHGQFQISVVTLIKKFAILDSKKKDKNKNFFIESIYKLLNSPLRPKCKEHLGVSLEYILNHDEENLYRMAVFTKVYETMSSKPDHYTKEGCCMCCVACLNSLIEVEDQYDFLLKMLEPVNANLLIILEDLKSRPQQALYTEQCLRLLGLARRFFDFIELACSRICDEQDILEISKDMSLIRKMPSLHVVLYNYFNSFGYFKSIISPIPSINAVKEIMVQILFHLYREHPMPEDIFSLLFVTMLLECSKQQYGEEDEHIVSRIIELMEHNLSKKIYEQTFYDHKMQVVIAMMTYAVTKQEELQLLEEEPERFVEIAEEFTEGFHSSISIKVRAGEFLKKFASAFDQILKSILQVVVIIVSSAMESANGSKQTEESPCVQLYSTIKNQFPEFDFFQLDISLQLECALNVLSVLSKQIVLRQDLKRVVYALLVTHSANLQKITAPIVSLRLIRMVGYYPTAVYYPFVKVKMSEGKVFVLQGLKTYERILKANKHPQIFTLLSQVFEELIPLISVNDTIFEIIILNHYERMLRLNLNLFNAFLIKIRDTFIELLENNQHVAILSVGYLGNILKREPQHSYRVKICEYFYAMFSFYNKAVEFYQQKKSASTEQQENKQKKLRILSNFQEKFTQVFLLIARKQVSLNEAVVEYSTKKVKELSKHHRKSEIFTFLNNVFLKIDGNFQNMDIFYKETMKCVKFIFARNDQISRHIDIVPKVCFLISQLLVSFFDVHLQKNDMFFLLKVVDFCPEQYRQFILLVTLSYIYVQPSKTRSLLIEQNCYEDALKLFLTSKYKEPLIRKAFLLAMTKILQLQEAYFDDIIKQCLKYFKQEIEKNQIKAQKRKPYVDPKLRRMFQDELNDDNDFGEQQMQNKDHISATVFQELKHPFVNMSEYDQFKVRVWQNMEVVNRLSEQYKKDLREVLQMDDCNGNSVRKIVTVKKP